MLLDTPRTVELMNGIYALLRFGLSSCGDGFGESLRPGSCRYDGDYSRASAVSQFVPALRDSEGVVNELAMLLTANRLSDESRSTIIDAYESKLPNKEAALILAQQLVVSSPECTYC